LAKSPSHLFFAERLDRIRDHDAICPTASFRVTRVANAHALIAPAMRLDEGRH